MVSLIAAAVPDHGGTWADLGAGTGNFTWALAELPGTNGTIYALDRDLRAIVAQRKRMVQDPPRATIIPRQVDFIQKLDVPALDGVLIANALHFIKDQTRALKEIYARMKPQSRLLVVEYEVEQVLRWAPYPLPMARFVTLARANGFVAPQLVGQRRSPSSGVVMYAAVVIKQG